MRTLNKHIVLFLGLFVIGGLFSSLAHYHSEGLECVEHAQEAHYVKNEATCPVSTLLAGFDVDTRLSFDGFITPQNVLLKELILPSSEDHHELFLGRDPPA